eukprot:4114650-Pyramimonas_sp.AAC.1
MEEGAGGGGGLVVQVRLGPWRADIASSVDRSSLRRTKLASTSVLMTRDRISGDSRYFFAAMLANSSAM